MLPVSEPGMICVANQSRMSSLSKLPAIRIEHVCLHQEPKDPVTGWMYTSTAISWSQTRQRISSCCSWASTRRSIGPPAPMCLWSSRPGRWSPRTGLSKKFWATFTAQPNQWHCATSVFKCFGPRNSRTIGSLSEWKASGWHHNGSMAKRPLPGMGRHMPRYICSISLTSLEHIVAGATAAEAETEKRTKYYAAKSRPGSKFPPWFYVC